MTGSDRLIYAALMAACATLFIYGIADEDMVISVIAFFAALIASYDMARH
jgi:hypothetical protein